MMLWDVLVRSKRQHFSIAFYGLVKASKSPFLNTLMSESILPSDGESVDTRMPRSILGVTAELPMPASPCRRPDGS